MRSIIRLALLAFLVTPLTAYADGPEGEPHVDPHAATVPAPSADAIAEGKFLSNTRQLTFAGRRTGEGYFSADGKKIIFQSERDADNPFYQIYLMDLETGDTERVSPGIGKTTCSWIHPSNTKVLFASTHEDPDAKKKQEAELADRAAGKQKRYAWDYDAFYDIYEKDLTTGKLTNLTHTQGYDAEGSYSPDGKLIAFASNRRAYSEKLSDEDQKNFERDPAYMMDLYIMNADGSNVRQLTTEPGYDGGPFFSADGKRICYRHFSVDGATAEIWTMNIDGSDKRQITHMGAMSWAPYFHPSGQYLIFTTNKHGFDNFELYIVGADGKHEPVRVTHTPGFDGLPVFSPDGKKLAWTSNRNASHQSQIFIADWNSEAAIEQLNVSAGSRTQTPPGTSTLSISGHGGGIILTYDGVKESWSLPVDQDITSDDCFAVVRTLSDDFDGRLTGTKGEDRATKYVEVVFDHFKLAPTFDPFDFTAGVSLGKDNALHFSLEEAADYRVDQRWRPLPFSATGKAAAAPVVFAGYGIVAPKSDGQEEYDSFVHLDVKGKWIIVLRYMPENITPERRQHLARYASLRYKAMVARDKGAAGLIVVSGPNSKVRDQLIPLGFDASLAGTSIPAISLVDEVAAAWLKAGKKNLKELQDKLDTGDMVMGFDIPGAQLSATIDIVQEKRTGRNVIARLQAGDKPSAEAILIGAHVDHLGKGKHSGSLAHSDEEAGIHHGADDNASGVAAMLEIAQWMADQKTSGKLKMKRDVIFAAWSGEEEGLLGSAHYVKNLPKDTKIVACLNMDMVGRLRNNTLTMQGTGSSGIWAQLIEQANAAIGLNIVTQSDAYLPTDSTSFYVAGIPAINAFTGAHEDYHRPTDTADKINYDGLAKVAKLMGLIARQLVVSDKPVDYLAMKGPEKGEHRAGLRAYLGTVPDYAAGDVKGLKLSGVGKGGPAEKAGLKAGDVIVKLSGKKIENIYDYTYAIDAVKIGVPTEIIVVRDGKEVTLSITPGSRE